MRKRRKIIREKELKKRNKKIILSSIFILLIMSVGYGAFETVIRITASGHVVFDERCVVGNIFNFTQKDEIQEFKVPCSGTYKLETWGAQGGKIDNTYYGGYGGYSVGNIQLKIKQKIYIVVGGQGGVNYGKDLNNVIAPGGYNGGGEGRSNNKLYDRLSAGGGGATHISYENGLLKSLSNYKGQLLGHYYDSEKILIVSGGGSGYWYASDSFRTINYGSGGGYIGGTGSGYYPNFGENALHYAHGGTQIGPYTETFTGDEGKYGNFGEGASLANGGGGGFFGGNVGHYAAGGGSGYIGNHSLTNKAMFCYDCEESLDLTKPEIFTISTTGETNYRDTLNCPDGFSENPVSKCAKEGDGYARITLVSKK